MTSPNAGQPDSLPSNLARPAQRALATAGYITLEQFARGQLHIAHRDAILAQYSYRYDRKARRLKVVETPCIFKENASLSRMSPTS